MIAVVSESMFGLFLERREIIRTMPRLQLRMVRKLPSAAPID
jgi:hypothetical protein